MNKLLKAELKTWNLKDPIKRAEKIERERVRYPKMLQEMGIDLIDTEEKTVIDIGSGPISVLRFIEARLKIAVDPLIDEYRKLHELDPAIKWWANKVEDVSLPNGFCDLVICMNALDHFEKPQRAIEVITRVLKAGGFFAVHCCINNAIYAPHLAHVKNLTYELFRSWVDEDFETVHERLVRFGWRKYKGKIGQPCFAWLGRKISSYDKG